MSAVPTNPALTAQQMTIPRAHVWYRLPLWSAAVGVAGLGASLALGSAGPEQLAFSYLVAFLFFLSLSLGGLFFVLVQFATRSGWSVVVRRMAEHTMGALALFIPLFVPIALSLHTLYHWTHAGAVAHDPVLQGKQAYLNEPFFYLRAAIYLLAWAALGLYFRARSVEQDRTASHAITRRLQAVSAPALVVFGLTITFAAFDWLMSLDPHWFSTIFGVYFFAGTALGGIALLVVMAVGARWAKLTGPAVTAEHFHDLGKLLLTFVAFWAYIAFSQYLLIWYANIPEETIWYRARWQGAWRAVSVALALGHFALPFFFLLPRAVKRNTVLLLGAALWTLAAHYVDLYWLVMPVLHKNGAVFTLLDATTMLGVGGLFVAVVSWLMRRRALVPVGDPRLPESLAFENI